MCQPGFDHFFGSVVVLQGLDQNLAPACELASENAMRLVGLVERAALVLHRSAEVRSGVLEFEALDAFAIGARKHEADHHVVEAAIDELVHDGAQLGLSAELFE